MSPRSHPDADVAVRQRRYQLFLSHSHADADLVVAMAQQLDDLGLSCFLDQWEMVPGESSVKGLEEALSASDAVAVIVATHGMGRWHAEEARQALKQSIDHGTRAFVVWLPGSDSDPPDLPGWLRERTYVDLSGDLRDGHVGRDGLIRLASGALGVTPRQAAKWVAERLPAAPAAGPRSSGDEGG